MSNSRWPLAGAGLATLALLVGPPLLVRRLGWPLDEHNSWTWFVQYLRSGTVPDEVVIAGLVIALWALWAAHLVVVAGDIVAALRGLTPRIGLVRLVWLLVAGGTAATSTHTVAVAAPADAVAEAPADPEPSPEENGDAAQTDQETIERNRTLSGFAFDSAVLSPEKKEALIPTIELLDAFAYSGTPVVVTGYTDPIGDPAYNQTLAEERAQAVASHLREHLGDTVEIQASGGGAAEPTAEAQMPYEAHRRVEIAYSLQLVRPSPEPEPVEEEPATATDSPDSVSVAPDTRRGENSAPAGVAIGAVAGTVGAAAGYATGRMRASVSATKSRTSRSTPAPEADDTSADAQSTGLDEEELVRQDPGGAARGALDEDGYVLVADTVRVNSRGGLAFTGRYAAAALAAVATDHTAGRTIATSTVAAAVEETADALPRGIHTVSDIHGVPVAVDTELLSSARHEHEEEEPVEQAENEVATGRLLVLFGADEADAHADLCGPLLASSDVAVCVLGPTAHASVEVRCDQTDRVRLNSGNGERAIVAPLRHVPPPAAKEEHAPDTESGEPAPDTETAQEAEGETTVPESDGEHESSEAPPTFSGHVVQVRLFAAEPLITFEGKPVTGLRSVARTLLSFLALHPKGADAEQITEACFADGKPDKAAAHRRNAVHSLRSTLRPLLDAPGAPIVIQESGRYRIDKSLFDVDLWHFLRTTDALRKTVEENSHQYLIRVLELHKENLLHEREELWVEPVRERCTRVAVNACVRLAESAEDRQEKMQYLETAVLFDEFNEPLYQRMMALSRDSGLPEGAHQTYRALKHKLKMLGEKPSEESRRIIGECGVPSQ
ncbi:hypothetical protein GCM10007147_43920 [Nocardiopsis kunsanensis]|uniref:OmpA-like domain-containing protein n=1 Tax=Nocardiopsis kunsanensis TaxID=141693 RepID=A0A919CMQ2_9ACTN|nr:OmpA family protein [Nocardiopsis kunsanensis]GHD36531.1 hypothetical protein GCM10007147_43920 [Nocardiopsis kunsanensis]